MDAAHIATLEHFERQLAGSDQAQWDEDGEAFSAKGYEVGSVWAGLAGRTRVGLGFRGFASIGRGAGAGGMTGEGTEWGRRASVTGTVSRTVGRVCVCLRF